MRYEKFLAGVHERLQPRTYLEIGVSTGKSLALSRGRSVGIDPAFRILHEVDGDVALFRTTSDEYFARPEPLAPTGGRPFDLSFIDGLHLLENALRDFINAERCSTPSSAIILDDVLPRDVDEAARERHTGPWTGDVYPIIEILARYRPELAVVPLDTAPTGLLLVVGLDPTSTVLAEGFGEILARFRRPDPQPVPEDVLDRLPAATPARVLDTDVWRVLREGRDAPAADVRRDVTGVVATQLGSAYVAAGSAA